eukprot:CAMPEP_0178737998 /NCGR_PEP_ID=MMETSP0744-20121128/3280_1 /TAXON_ID=913974 /ORGANISM="Nitzschia punctata, Strain CCMP561" /LENGTH=369 /DNA_ID=CAMNT_0020390591 /DNA_START=54 /DNA_END=1163 /DNA_ORIENTATION=-
MDFEAAFNSFFGSKSIYDDRHNANEQLSRAGTLVDELTPYLERSGHKLENDDVSAAVLGLEPTPIGPQGIQSIVPSTLVPSMLGIESISPIEHTSDFSTLSGVSPNTNLINPYHSASSGSTMNQIFPSNVPQRDCLTNEDLGACLAPPTKNVWVSSSPSSWAAPTSAVLDSAAVSVLNQKMPTEVSASANKKNTISNDTNQHPTKLEDEKKRERFRSYQNGQWNERYKELKIFKQRFGHCEVPHNYVADNGSQALAQWVKRQRYQFKQRIQNKRTTITDERKAKLDELGFIWDSHRGAWEEKFEALLEFQKCHGHTSVPSKYEDKNLAIWVKCQRRQYKLYTLGEKSAMTKERIVRLESVEFEWNPRNL